MKDSIINMFVDAGLTVAEAVDLLHEIQGEIMAPLHRSMDLQMKTKVCR